MIKTYVRKPEPIQAIQWTGDNLEEIRRFIGYEKRNPKACDSDRLRDGAIELIIDTSTSRYDSWLRCVQYGYVYKLANGRICTLTREDFERRFEEFAHFTFSFMKESDSMKFSTIRDLISDFNRKGYEYYRYRIEKTNEYSEVYYFWEPIPEEVLNSRPKRWTSGYFYDQYGISHRELEILY